MSALSQPILPQFGLTIPSLAPAVGRLQRVALTNADDLAQAEARYKIIYPLLTYRLEVPGQRLLRLKDGTPVTSFTRMVEYVSENSGIAVGTLYRWLARYKEGGLPALADQRRCDKNTSRYFAKYPKSAWMAAYLYLEERMSIKVCHEVIVREHELLEIPVDELPSYETVRAFLKSMPPALEVYARRGRKAYRDRMSPYLKRLYTDIYSNEIWVGDHMIHDVEGANDCYDEAEYGSPVRIRLSMLLDFRSRYPVGRTWCWEGSSRAIVASMIRGFETCGMPDGVLFDNGHDYDKVAKGAAHRLVKDSPVAPKAWWKSEIEGIENSGFLRRCGITITNCLPYHPQGKHIERFFRGLHERFDKLWPTYTGGTPFSRPDTTSVAMAEHRRLVRAGRVDESKHPRVSRIIAECDAWMEEYADTEGMEGATPRQIFKEYRNPNQKPTPDPAALVLLMADREKRRVRECAVTVDKRRYMPVDQPGWATMHEFNERDVLVAYEKGAYEFAAALDLDGNFLAWLNVETLVRFAPGDPATQIIVSESMANRRRLEKGVRETVTTITRVARQIGAVSPLQAMQARHQLTAQPDVEGIITHRPQLAPPTTTEPENRLVPGQAADRLAERLRRTK
jgi:hypothetical protein